MVVPQKEGTKSSLVDRAGTGKERHHVSLVKGQTTTVVDRPRGDFVSSEVKTRRPL